MKKLENQQESHNVWDSYLYFGNAGRGWVTSFGTYSYPLGAYTMSFQLNYDGLTTGQGTVGNLTKVTEQDGSTVNYAYDGGALPKLNRLTSESRTGTQPYSTTYGYDLQGNRTSQGGTSYSFDDADMPTVGSG